MICKPQRQEESDERRNEEETNNKKKPPILEAQINLLFPLYGSNIFHPFTRTNHTKMTSVEKHTHTHGYVRL